MSHCVTISHPPSHPWSRSGTIVSVVKAPRHLSKVSRHPCGRNRKQSVRSARSAFRLCAVSSRMRGKGTRGMHRTMTRYSLSAGPPRTSSMAGAPCSWIHWGTLLIMGFDRMLCNHPCSKRTLLYFQFNGCKIKGQSERTSPYLLQPQDSVQSS